jgi:hypothetical protein
MTLLIVILSLVLFLGVWVALAWAHLRQTPEPEGLQTKAVESPPFSVLSIAMAFEPDHAMVWETQMPALQLISAARAGGVGVGRLYRSYLASAGRYPELYEGASFTQWLEFLEKAELIKRNNGRVALTAQGREFLHFRLAAHSIAALAAESSGWEEK